MFYLMREQCSTCIFREGNKMHLRPGRLVQMCRETDRNDANVTCHKSKRLEGVLEVDAICRGSFDRRPGQLARIADRLECIELVDEPVDSPLVEERNA